MAQRGLSTTLLAVGVLLLVLPNPRVVHAGGPLDSTINIRAIAGEPEHGGL